LSKQTNEDSVKGENAEEYWLDDVDESVPGENEDEHVRAVPEVKRLKFMQQYISHMEGPVWIKVVVLMFLFILSSHVLS